MNNVKELLCKEIEEELKALETMEFGSEEHKIANDTVGKLIDRYNEMDRIESEHRDKEEARNLEKELKSEQMADDRKDRFVKNILGGLTLGVSILGTIVLPIWGTNKSLKFEETGTVTTIAGRGWINKLFPKK